MAALAARAALVATAAAWCSQPRKAALAAVPVLAERGALAAASLEVMAVTAARGAAVPLLAERAARAAALGAVTAATAAMAALAGRLMAATRLVAMAATEFCSLLLTTSR